MLLKQLVRCSYAVQKEIPVDEARLVARVMEMASEYRAHTLAPQDYGHFLPNQ